MTLALPLFVLGTALANHPQHTAPPHHLAVLADRFDARTHLHTDSSKKEFFMSLEL